MAENDEVDEVLTPLPGYPPYSPPTSSKEQVFRVQDFTEVDQRAKQAPGHLTESFDDLVEHLTAPWTTDVQKVRSIFTWMGKQRIGTQTIEHAEPNTPEYYMMKAPNDKSRFITMLFVMLCRKAGIPSVAVKGKMKAAHYQLGDESTCANGLWTVVYTDNNWRFVHPHWAFSCLTNFRDGRWTLVENTGKALRQRNTANSGVSISQVDEFFFLTDPDKMIYYFHPLSTEQQLLSESFTFDAFVNMPKLGQGYFDSEWKLLRPHTVKVDAGDGVGTIDFLRPPTGTSELRYELYFDEDLSEGTLSEDHQVNMYIMRLKDDSGTASLVTRLPVKGTYKIEFTGRHDGRTLTLGEFLLICSSEPSNPKPFPPIPEHGFGYDDVAKNAGLTEPSCTQGVVPVQQGQTADFHFQVQDNVDVKPKLRHASRPSEDLGRHVDVTREASTLKVCVTLPGDDPNPEYSVELYVRKLQQLIAGGILGEDEDLDASFENVLSYLLTSDKKVEEASKDEAKELHKALEQALEGDEATLDRALDNFQRKGLYNPLLLNKAKTAQTARIRHRLSEAINSQSMDRLDCILSECEAQDMTDDDMIQRALKRLLYLAEMNIRSAMSSYSPWALRAALSRAANSKVADEAKKSEWYMKGQERMKMMSRAFDLFLYSVGLLILAVFVRVVQSP